MHKSKVALVRCNTYDEQEVYAAVKAGIDLLGGPQAFAAPREKILFKPNVLAGALPEECVCTHPSILTAAGRIFQGISTDLFYGDSPGPGDPVPHLQTAKISEAAEEYGLKLADFDEGQNVVFDDSPQAKRFLIANGILEADGIISLSKLKTHMLTRMTGAVKNLYGCIPGQSKRRYHLLYPDAFAFSQLLVALNLLLKPRIRLHIMDGIMAMEGNGPRNGDPVHLGVLLFSTDPVALDTVMCSLIGLNPLRVPTSGAARRWGLGTCEIDEIELLGDSLAAARPGSFKVQRGPIRELSTQGLLAIVNNIIAPRPVLDPRKCSRCGACIAACPMDPKAIDWRDEERRRAPAYNYSRCIRCYCCQEICPEGAITVKRTFLKL